MDGHVPTYMTGLALLRTALSLLTMNQEDVSICLNAPFEWILSTCMVKITDVHNGVYMILLIRNVQLMHEWS